MSTNNRSDWDYYFIIVLIGVSLFPLIIWCTWVAGKAQGHCSKEGVDQTSSAVILIA